MDSPASTTEDMLSGLFVRRLMIVRRGATNVYEQLQKAFGDDHKTVIVYDRRSRSRRDGVDEARGLHDLARERRPAEEADILNVRGFYSTRSRPPTGGSLTARRRAYR